MTMKEITKLCGIKNLKYFYESSIIQALEVDVIERLYPHPNHPRQKYRLAEAAQKLKMALTQTI